MKRHLNVIKILLMFILVIGPAGVVSAQKHASPDKSGKIELPSSVVKIGKENTFQNSERDFPNLLPSEFAKELLDSSKVKIDNPNLIRMLNESAINKSPFSIGVRATIYLGEWPLNYQSSETSPNWEYQKVNTNYYDNRGGQANYQIHYVQESQKMIKGVLTAKVPNAEDVQKMILHTAMEKSKLPLTFETVIGAGTKHHHIYNVAPNRLGNLTAYAPAINEKGEITYGEVYLVMRGTKRNIVVKNVTTQAIGAWIPIQDHLSFTFH